MKPIFILLILCSGLGWAMPEAQAGRVELGLGIANKDHTLMMDKIPALRMSGRIERGPFGFFNNAMVRPTSTSASLGGLAHTLLSVGSIAGADVRLGTYKEWAVLAVGADWGFGTRAFVPRGVSGAPRLYVELEARMREHIEVGLDERGEFLISNSKMRLNVGPAIGAAVDVWINGKAGLRVGIENRMFVESSSSAMISEVPDPRVGLRNRFGVTVDVLFGTGGER